DLLMSDILLAVNIPDPAINNRGGRHSEWGSALMNSMEMHIVGPREHVFHYADGAFIWNSVEEFLANRPVGTPCLKPKFGVDQLTQRYRRFVSEFAKYPGANQRTLKELAYLGCSIAGETGEVADLIKKALRMGEVS